MKKQLRIPFTNMTPRSWQNLAIAASITFYLILMGSVYFGFGMCQESAVDFCAYWVSGKIVNQQGYADVYDMSIQQQFQQNYFEFARNPLAQTFAVMYPPIFLVPYQILSWLSPGVSHFLWASINLLAFFFYLKFFTKKIGKIPLSSRYLLMLLVSLPVFVNFYEGQVNIWLAICAGEFIRALNEGKNYRAGLWLGGWLIKPQILILVIPFILFQRLFKSFLGFLTTSLVVLISSFFLIGTKGFETLFQILLHSAEGGGVSNPAGMANWRMLGTQISFLFSKNVGLLVALIGSIVTIGFTFYYLRKKFDPKSTEMVIALLAIFSSTLLVTWHAHFHMMLIIIPAVYYLLNKERFNKKLFLFWVFMPIVVEFINRNSLIFYNIGFSLVILGSTIKLLEGLRGFVLNGLVLLWSLKALSKAELRSELGNTIAEKSAMKINGE